MSQPKWESTLGNARLLLVSLSPRELGSRAQRVATALNCFSSPIAGSTVLRSLYAPFEDRRGRGGGFLGAPAACW